MGKTFKWRSVRIGAGVVACLLTSGVPATALGGQEEGAPALSPSIPAPTPATSLTPETVLTRIAFGSCADEEKPQPIWDAIRAASPQLFLFSGDNVYADINEGNWVNEPNAGALAFAYGKLGTHPDFLAAYSEIPMQVIWDDHDYGKNDAGRDFPLKAVAKDTMLDFFSVADEDPRRKREGVYHAHTYGPPGKRVQVIMLDTRWFRSELTRTDEYGAAGKERYLPSDDPAQTMLGDAQWQWLERTLQEPADIRLLVSPIQVLAETHGWEAWRTMPREREKLYGMLNGAAGGRVIILSGDRHVGGVYRRTGLADYPLYEVTSSSLNLSFNPSKAVTKERDDNQVGLLYGPENFGMLDIDWQQELISLNLKDIYGATVRSVMIPFAEISKSVTETDSE